MHIDWFTLAAQIVNFLILVALLKHFLYRPVSEAMARREALIAARLHEAEEREEDAERRKGHLDEELAALERAREGELATAREAAETERRRLLEGARRELEEIRGQWHEQLAEEQERILHDVRLQVAEQVCGITRRVLAEMADERLEERLFRVFLRRLEGVDEAERAELCAACGGEVLPLLRSRFELSAESREEARRTLGRLVGGEPQLRFEHGDELGCGVELEIPGRIIGWRMDDYVEELGRHLSSALNRKAN